MIAETVENLILDDTLKGIPGGVDPFLVGAAGAQRWNVLAEDLPLPLAVLKQSAMDRNSAWMRRFLDASTFHRCAPAAPTRNGAASTALSRFRPGKRPVAPSADRTSTFSMSPR